MEDHFDDAVGRDALRRSEVPGSLELEVPEQTYIGLEQGMGFKLEVLHRPA